MKPIKIKPYNAIVQEAVRELGTKLQNVDIIMLEPSCPGDKLAWVSNQDLLKNRPGEEKIIHLCLKKIEDHFKKHFNKNYSGSISDNLKMKEIIKEFLIHVVLPHEYTHIEQELEHGGTFGTSPETKAEKAEDWSYMKPYNITKNASTIINALDKIASKLENAGCIKDAITIDVISNTIEAMTKEANLVNYFINLVKYLKNGPKNLNEVYNKIKYGIKQWPTYSPNEKKAIATALDNALKGIGVQAPHMDPDLPQYNKLSMDQWISVLAKWLINSVSDATEKDKLNDMDYIDTLNIKK